MNRDSLLFEIESALDDLKRSSTFTYFFPNNPFKNRKLAEKMALLEIHCLLYRRLKSVRITLFPFGFEHHVPTTSYKFDNILLLSEEKGDKISLIEVRKAPFKTATVISRDLSMLKLFLDQSFIQLGVIILIGFTSIEMMEKIKVLVKKWQPKKENNPIIFLFNEGFKLKKIG